jgi:hypothetical protein
MRNYFKINYKQNKENKKCFNHNKNFKLKYKIKKL